jgi:HAD superfamily hydrolase (TIGR01459 family)
MTEYLKGISQLANKFDYFIIDLWGVLHDGVTPYPSAPECLAKLKAAGKKIILLSNAPRRAERAVKVLDDLGYTNKYYDAVITSGEVAYEYVRKAPKIGYRFYYIGPEKDEDILEGLIKTRVFRPSDANFAITTGFESFESSIDEKKKELDECLAAGIPLICANPDRKVVRQTGEVQLCAGLMAEYYEKEGGDVIYFGKPYANAYYKCFDFWGLEDPTQVCCIGDSLHTDVAGANLLGAHSVLVAGGIHLNDLDIKYGELPNKDKLQSLCEIENEYPKAIISNFSW